MIGPVNRVAVLGAGLQGACVALELALNGIHVDLYDKNAVPVSQTSANNEGKIHLGYIYANDPTLRTARFMVRGALTFAPLLRRWIGAAIDDVPISTPFYYAVHRDSLLSADQVERHLRACAALAQAEEAGEAVYFGLDYTVAPQRLADCRPFFDPSMVLAGFETQEIAISPRVLAMHIRTRLAAEPTVRCVLGARVVDAAVSEAHAEVEFEAGGGRFHEGYDYVVNTLWDGRLAIDAKIGLRPSRPWLFRYKQDLLGPDNPSLDFPSTTIVLGPYGDVARYGNGDLRLSWYPVGKRASSSELAPPDWSAVMNKTASEEQRREILAGLAGIVPGLAGLAPLCPDTWSVVDGVVFAWGAGDIDDPASLLHTRADIGPAYHGRYCSIDTGKLTTAPLFAKMAADRIRGA